jgi:hypothetical protein
VFRILTEDKNRGLIHSILNRFVDGYTLIESTGSWKHVREKSLAIDLVGVDETTVNEIAKTIKQQNGQDSVLVLNIPVTYQFV